MDNADKPAFPKTIASQVAGGVKNFEILGGLTKRERFAMAAMQGMLGMENLNQSFRGSEFDQKGVPREAVRLADALLNELQKEDK